MTKSRKCEHGMMPWECSDCIDYSHWHHVNDSKPSNENIIIVAVIGNISIIRDLAWYDIDGDCWENLKGEKINPVLWCDIELPTIPDRHYF